MTSLRAREASQGVRYESGVLSNLVAHPRNWLLVRVIMTRTQTPRLCWKKYEVLGNWRRARRGVSCCSARKREATQRRTMAGSEQSPSSTALLMPKRTSRRVRRSKNPVSLTPTH